MKIYSGTHIIIEVAGVMVTNEFPISPLWGGPFSGCCGYWKPFMVLMVLGALPLLRLTSKTPLLSSVVHDNLLFGKLYILWNIELLVVTLPASQQFGRYWLNCGISVLIWAFYYSSFQSVFLDALGLYQWFSNPSMHQTVWKAFFKQIARLHF